MLTNQEKFELEASLCRARRSKKSRKRRAPLATTGADPLPNTPLDFRTLFETDFDAERWRLWPLVQCGQVAALYGPPKVGKSLVLLDLIVHSIRGAAKGEAPASPLRVLYLDRENSARDIARRLRDLGGSPSDLGNLKYISFPQIDWLDTEAGGEQLLALARRHRANLVVLDSVSRFVQGSENEASTWNALYAHSLAPLKGAEIASLRVDHTGKQEDRGMRGSSAKASDVDAAWSLSFDETSGTRGLIRTHTRDGLGQGELTLRVLHKPLDHIVVSPSTTKAKILAEQLRRLGFPASGSRSAARDLLRPYKFPMSNQDFGEAKKLLGMDDPHGPSKPNHAA